MMIRSMGYDDTIYGIRRYDIWDMMIRDMQLTQSSYLDIDMKLFFIADEPSRFIFFLSLPLRNYLMECHNDVIVLPQMQA